MKKTIITIVASILIVGIAQAQTGDFRGFAWGNTFEKIQTTEKLPVIIKEVNDELQYKDELGGAACSVVYIFNDNNKLTSGLYVFSKKYSNPQLYVQDYNKFKALLSEKYGKPSEERDNWNLSTPAFEKHNYGQAIADGNLALNTLWTTDRSVIKIALVTVDKHPVLKIYYTARSLDEMEDKDELKKALGKL